MRPVDKGEKPYSSIKNYEEARPYLKDRLGEMCSYCEMNLDTGLAVEHIQPKSRYPKKECNWDNLLLACPNCNSTKKNTDINNTNIGDYLWPDKDNTFLALKYSEGGFVGVNPFLPKHIRDKAQKLIDLVELNRIILDVKKKKLDIRWLKRFEILGKAERAKARLAKFEGKGIDDLLRKEMVEAIEDMLEGYFSIWMTVFADDADMKRRIIDKFIGTAKDCFDENGNPVPRKGGQI